MSDALALVVAMTPDRVIGHRGERLGLPDLGLSNSHVLGAAGRLP